MAVALWVHFGWKTSKSICNYSFFRQSYPFRMKFSLLTYYFIVIFLVYTYLLVTGFYVQQQWQQRRQPVNGSLSVQHSIWNCKLKVLFLIRFFIHGKSLIYFHTHIRTNITAHTHVCERSYWVQLQILFESILCACSVSLVSVQGYGSQRPFLLHLRVCVCCQLLGAAFTFMYTVGDSPGLKCWRFLEFSIIIFHPLWFYLNIHLHLFIQHWIIKKIFCCALSEKFCKYFNLQHICMYLCIYIEISLRAPFWVSLRQM